MLFTTLAFAAFLPAATVLHWALPRRLRNLFLLAASYWFYACWGVPMAGLLAGMTLVAWGGARLLARARTRRGRAAWFWAAAGLCLANLFFFKYWNFAATALSDAATACGLGLRPHLLRLAMPVGVSFYTFKLLSYLADVRRGTAEPERSPLRFALYVAFFPAIASGPIDRAGGLLAQLRDENRAFSEAKAVRGAQLFAWGLFKKLVVSDALAAIVDATWAAVPTHAGATLCVVAVLYAIQLYCDFSGYSDMAIGAAKWFGLDLMENFRRPYFARSFKEFWGRWHVSLSTWLRDYVYIPLGGSRCGALRRRVNVMATFLVSGIWHGANWTFVAWGLLHGLAQVVEMPFVKKRPKGAPPPPRTAAGAAGDAVRMALTFALACAFWVFFRAPTLADAWAFLVRAATDLGQPWDAVVRDLARVGLDAATAWRLALPLALLLVFDAVSERADPLDWLARRPAFVRWAVHAAFIALCVHYVLAYGRGGQNFIYFQF